MTDIHIYIYTHIFNMYIYIYTYTDMIPDGNSNPAGFGYEICWFWICCLANSLGIQLDKASLLGAEMIEKSKW